MKPWLDDGDLKLLHSKIAESRRILDAGFEEHNPVAVFLMLLRMLGNAVVPHQAALAMRLLLSPHKEVTSSDVSELLS